MDKKLTPKQAAFVAEYLVDLNGADAARRAGYSAKTASVQAAQMMAMPHIKAAVDAATEARSQRTEITADRVLKELAKIGFADVRKAVTWGSRFVERQEETVASETLEDQPNGGAPKRRQGDDGSDAFYVTTIDLTASEDLDADTAAAIAEVAQTKEGVRIKFHDKQAALVNIGRHLGMFKDKIEHVGGLITKIELVAAGPDDGDS